jgi:hypothetical protein
MWGGYIYDPAESPSLRAARFEKRMTVAEYLAWEADQVRQREAEREADLRIQRAWNATRDAYASEGDWLMVLAMDNA